MSSSSSSLSIFQGVNDVQDYVSVDGEELVPDHFSSLFDLVKKGNRAFRDGRFEEAIHCYSKAYTVKPGDPIILSNRCAAYLRISDFLKLRPAAVSEYRPLNGLDPTIHAELALKDAEKLMSIQGHSVKAYVLKANALFLLEKYEIARDVILSGLQVDPLSNFLQDVLQVLEKTEGVLLGRKNHGKAERTDDFDCTLCLKLLYDPITTPCGHSFCRDCLFQSMDRSNKCPLCRTVLFISPRTCALSVTLNNIIQKNFQEEYAERKVEHNSLTNLGIDLIPLFVMDVILPCQKISLHIFEPRYRLMVRRIMEGNHRMGMVMVDSTTGSIAEFACEVEITECEPLPDGRFYLEVESRHRFQIIRSWDQDGYRVAEVEWIHDDRPLEGTQESAELLEIANNAAEYARSWITRMKEAVWQDRRNLDKLLIAESLMPSPQDAERLSFWINTLSHQRPTERLKLLRLKDTRERLKHGLVCMRTGEQSCSVQ